MRPKINGSNILVTGGAGFIGSHLVDRLLSEGAKSIVAVDNMFAGSESNLQNAISKGVILYKDDIEICSSLEYIFTNHNIDIVFNLATKALNYSFVNPKNAFDTNVNGVLNLLEFQKKGFFKTLVHFSTSEVYGSAVYEPMDEKHPIFPTTAYAAGKAAADLALASWVKMFNLDAFIVRPFNNYGPRQNYKGYLSGVIPITVYKILNGIPPEIHGDGKQSRDFIYVYDTIDSIMKLYSVMEAGDSVNISSKNQTSISDVIHKIANIMNYKDDIISKDARASDVKCHNASNSKLISLIGDTNNTTFDDGLRQTINWYKENIK